MNIYNNDTGLTAPKGPCNSFIIRVYLDTIDKVNVCECLFWADGVEITEQAQPNLIRTIPVQADGTQDEVESRVFAGSPFHFGSEIVTLSNDNIIGTYP